MPACTTRLRRCAAVATSTATLLLVGATGLAALTGTAEAGTPAATARSAMAPRTSVSSAATVTPVAPTITQSACTSNLHGPSDPTYTVPSVTGVDYYDGGTLLNPGQTYDATAGTTVTITAVAENGYTLDPNSPSSFTLVFDPAPDCTTDVVAAAPRLHPASCTGSGTSKPATVTIPYVKGVDYSIDGILAAPGTASIAPGAHTITATAEPGYRIQGTRTFPVTVPDRPQCLALATPVTPSVTQASCTNETLRAPSYTIPHAAGVIYSVGGMVRAAGTYPTRAGQPLTVTAVPDAGYRFAGAPERTFALQVAKAPTCVQGAQFTRHHSGTSNGSSSAAPAVLTAAGQAQATTLPFTGSHTRDLLIAAFAALAAGSVLTLAGSVRRRRFTSGS